MRLSSLGCNFRTFLFAFAVFRCFEDVIEMQTNEKCRFCNPTYCCSYDIRSVAVAATSDDVCVCVCVANRKMVGN